jgi:hypothetical protein
VVGDVQFGLGWFSEGLAGLLGVARSLAHGLAGSIFEAEDAFVEVAGFAG